MTITQLFEYHLGQACGLNPKPIDHRAAAEFLRALVDVRGTTLIENEARLRILQKASKIT